MITRRRRAAQGGGSARIGSLLVIKAGDAAEARLRLEADPYFAAGVWASITCEGIPRGRWRLGRRRDMEAGRRLVPHAGAAALHPAQVDPHQRRIGRGPAVTFRTLGIVLVDIEHQRGLCCGYPRPR